MYPQNRMVKSQASPISIEHKRENHIVLERICWPFAFLIQMSIPTLLLKLEKVASTLHFSLPRVSFVHLTSLSSVFIDWLGWVLVAMGVRVCDELCCVQFAQLQPSRICLALSTTVLLESVICYHNLEISSFPYTPQNSNDYLYLSCRHMI